MLRTRQIFGRYWSLGAALILPVIGIVVESTISRSWDCEKITLAVISVVCVALLVLSWFKQRKYTQSKWRLAFFTILLSLLALGPLWLGLNVVRSYSYAGEQPYTLYGAFVHLQDAVVRLAKVLCAVVLLWVVVDLARWIGRRKSIAGQSPH